MVISWADQILELVETGSLTEAIELTTSYWIGRPDLETIGSILKAEGSTEQICSKDWFEVAPKLASLSII